MTDEYIHTYIPLGLFPNFWKFYRIRTDFTLGELVSLVKAFRLEWIVLGVESVDMVGRV